MRTLSPALAAVMLVALLFAAGPRQAYACTCATLPVDEERAREYLSSEGTLTIVGLVEPTQDSSAAVRTVRAERVYAGERRASYQVFSNNCTGLVVDLTPGRRYVLQMRPAADDTFEASPCSSGELGVRGHKNADEYVRLLNRMFPAPHTEPPTQSPAPPTDDRDDNRNRNPYLIAAAAIALAAVATATTIIMRRRRA